MGAKRINRRAQLKVIHELARDLYLHFEAMGEAPLAKLAEDICKTAAFRKYIPPKFENHVLVTSGKTVIAYRSVKDINTDKLLDLAYEIKHSEMLAAPKIPDFIREFADKLHACATDLHYGVSFNEGAGRLS